MQILVSATIRGTLPAAAELLDGALHVGFSHAEFPSPAGAIALERTPTSLLTVAAQRLPKNFGLGGAFPLGQAFRGDGINPVHQLVCSPRVVAAAQRRASAIMSGSCSDQSCRVAGSKSAPLGQTSVWTSRSSETALNWLTSRNGP